jgi:hypothetical protein
MYSDATASLLQQLEPLDPEDQRELVDAGEQFDTWTSPRSPPGSRRRGK